MSEDTNSPTPVNGAECDLLWGAEKIAPAIGRTKRQLYHLVATGQLKSIKHVGKGLVASRAGFQNARTWRITRRVRGVGREPMAQPAYRRPCECF